MKKIIFFSILFILTGLHYGTTRAAPTSTRVQNLFISDRASTGFVLSINSAGLVVTSTDATGSGTISTSSPLTAGQWIIAGSYNQIYSTSSQPILTINASGTLIQIGSVSATGTIILGISQNLANYTNNAGFWTSSTPSANSPIVYNSNTGVFSGGVTTSSVLTGNLVLIGAGGSALQTTSTVLITGVSGPLSLSYNTLTNLFSSTSLSASSPITYNSNTGVFGGGISTTTVLTNGQWIIGGGAASIYSTSSQPVLTVSASGTLIQVSSISATGTLILGVRSDVSTTTGANPSVSVGLTATNGTLNTFMRSDAAPALSQSIAPSWTSFHQFFTAGASTTQLWSASTSIDFSNALILTNATNKLIAYTGSACGGTDQVISVSATGTVTCSAQGSGGGADGVGLTTSTAGSYRAGNLTFFLSSSTVSATSGIWVSSSTGELFIIGNFNSSGTITQSGTQVATSTIYGTVGNVVILNSANSLNTTSTILINTANSPLSLSGGTLSCPTCSTTDLVGITTSSLGSYTGGNLFFVFSSSTAIASSGLRFVSSTGDLYLFGNFNSSGTITQSGTQVSTGSILGTVGNVAILNAANQVNTTSTILINTANSPLSLSGGTLSCSTCSTTDLVGITTSSLGSYTGGNLFFIFNTSTAIASSGLTFTSSTGLLQVFGTVSSTARLSSTTFPTITSALALTDSSGFLTGYAGSSCGGTNQVASISATGVVTCTAAGGSDLVGVTTSSPIFEYSLPYFLPGNSSSVVRTTSTIGFNATSGRLFVGGSNVANVTSVIHAATMDGTGKAFCMTGAGSGGGTTDANQGMCMVLTFNNTGNRQLTFLASEQIGFDANNGFRFILGFDVPSMDAVDGDANEVKNLTLGGTGSNVGVGFGSADTQAEVHSKLTVKAQTGLLTASSSLAVVNTSEAILFTIGTTGHLNSSTTKPTVGTCGTSPSIVGTDTAFRVTTGSNASSTCTITFSTTYDTAPVCTFATETTAQRVSTSTIITPSATTVVISQSSSTQFNSAVFDVLCIGIQPKR